MATERDAPGAVVVARAGRLDALVLDACPTLSRRVVRRLIDDGVVRLNGRRVGRGARVVPGDRVLLPPWRLEPEADLLVPLVHVDARVVVVDKPGGMPGHALDPRQRGTLAGYLAGRFPEIADVGDPLASGLAHRLDTGTSGLQVAARTAEVYAALRRAFRAGAVTKHYLAVVAGVPPARATVDTPLAHHPADRTRMIAARPGDRAWPARSEVERLATARDRALVRITLHTGVTHQVRAHLAELGTPVLGDALYGGPGTPELRPGRHALHAHAIVPTDGAAGLLPALASPLPGELAALLET